MKLSLYLLVGLSLFAQTAPTTIPSDPDVMDLTPLLNSNFSAIYNGIGQRGTSLPATCSPGQLYTWQGTRSGDYEYRCVAQNQWALNRSPFTIGLVPNKATYISQRIDLTAGDNPLFTCPVNKACVVTLPTVLVNDGSSAQYSTGTLSLTYGSSTVTGVGTNFTSGMSPARIHLTAANVDLYVIGFGSSTSLLLPGSWTGTTQSGLAYTIHYGSGKVGMYAIHNGTRFLVLNAANGVNVPAGSPTATNTALLASTRLDGGETLGLTSTVSGISGNYIVTITDPPQFNRSISNWNLAGGSPITVYSCPETVNQCVLSRTTPNSFGSTSASSFSIWYDTGPSSTIFELHVLRAGDTGIGPHTYALTSHTTLISGVMSGLSMANNTQLNPGDSLVVWFPDPSVTNGVFVANSTESPLEP